MQSPSFSFRLLYFAFKVVSVTPFLSCKWADLVEILWTFDVTLGQKSINISAKSVHKWLRKDVSDATLDGKIQQPKLKGRVLFM